MNRVIKDLKPIQGGQDKHQLAGYAISEWFLSYGETAHSHYEFYKDSAGNQLSREIVDFETLVVRDGLGKADPATGEMVEEPGVNGGVLIFRSKALALKLADEWPAKQAEFEAKALVTAKAIQQAEEEKLAAQRAALGMAPAAAPMDAADRLELEQLRAEKAKATATAKGK